MPQSIYEVLPLPPRSSPAYPAALASLSWHRPPGSSDSLPVLVSQTTCGSCHPSAPAHQNAASAPAARGAPCVSAPGSTDPPLASNVAMSPDASPDCPRWPGAHWPMSVRTSLLLPRSTSSAAISIPALEISSASLGSTLSRRCRASVPRRLPFRIAARSASPAGSSDSGSLPRPPTSTLHSLLGPALPPAAALVCSSMSFPAKTSSGGFSLGDISNEGTRGHYQSGATGTAVRLFALGLTRFGSLLEIAAGEDRWEGWITVRVLRV